MVLETAAAALVSRERALSASSPLRDFHARTSQTPKVVYFLNRYTMSSQKKLRIDQTPALQ